MPITQERMRWEVKTVDSLEVYYPTGPKTLGKFPSQKDIWSQMKGAKDLRRKTKFF